MEQKENIPQFKVWDNFLKKYGCDWSVIEQRVKEFKLENPELLGLTHG